MRAAVCPCPAQQSFGNAIGAAVAYAVACDCCFSGFAGEKNTSAWRAYKDVPFLGERNEIKEKQTSACHCCIFPAFSLDLAFSETYMVTGYRHKKGTTTANAPFYTSILLYTQFGLRSAPAATVLFFFFLFGCMCGNNSPDKRVGVEHN